VARRENRRSGETRQGGRRSRQSSREVEVLEVLEVIEVQIPTCTSGTSVTSGTRGSGTRHHRGLEPASGQLVLQRARDNRPDGGVLLCHLVGKEIHAVRRIQKTGAGAWMIKDPVLPHDAVL
jgi:hypothetical protein